MLFRIWAKHIPLVMGLYSVLAFASVAPIAQIASASHEAEGIWVKMCATGTQMFIPISGVNDNDIPDEPSSPSNHSQACHACTDRRSADIADADADDGDDDSSV